MTETTDPKSRMVNLTLAGSLIDILSDPEVTAKTEVIEASERYLAEATQSVCGRGTRWNGPASAGDAETMLQHVFAYGLTLLGSDDTFVRMRGRQVLRTTGSAVDQLRKSGNVAVALDQVDRTVTVDSYTEEEIAEMGTRLATNAERAHRASVEAMKARIAGA